MARDFVIRWDPAEDFISLREAMNRLFEDSFVRAAFGSRSRNGESSQNQPVLLPVDIYETATHYTLRAYVPGVRPDDVDITIENGILTLKGNLPAEKMGEGTWHRRELWYGPFSRTISLPDHVDINKVEAHFNNGLLTLTLPKREEVQPRTIQVKIKN